VTRPARPDASTAFSTPPVAINDPFTKKPFYFNTLKSVQTWTLTGSRTAAPT
jgi:hypothetical protein